MAKQAELPSSSLSVALLLSLAGGFLDSYTFFNRGGVFSNAQTGNIVLLGVSLVNGQGESFLRYLIPILAFLVGIVLSLTVEHVLNRLHIRMVRRGILVLEMAILAAVALLPVEDRFFNMAANVLVSFVCAMQMETFRTFRGEPIATTMSTGNLRKCAENLFHGWIKHERERLRIAGYYLSVILVFVLGAALSALCSDIFAGLAALMPVGILGAAIVVITVKKR